MPRHAVPLLAALLAALTLAGCVPYALRQILDGPTGKALTISPEATIVPASTKVTFTAAGGVPPYVYSIISGGGTLNTSNGEYTAPSLVGSAEIRVTDATGASAKAVATIQAFFTSLSIGPGALSLMIGSNVTFTASGGAPPYTFALQSAGSGSPSINASSGYYVAGNTPGTTDVVKVTDSKAVVVTATVTVTALTSTIDYTIPSTSLTATGTASSAIPGGSTFTLKNNGAGPGSQTVDWKVFLSANTTIDGGDMMVASGTAAPLAAGTSTAVTVTGSFPAVAAGAWYLIAHVDAADDTTPANNTSGASSLTLDPLDIDYTVPSVMNTGGTLADAALNGTLSITNSGADAGFADVEWTVYASLDAVLDGADYLVARGDLSALGAGASSGAIAFSGYWPSTPDTWMLIATVSALDDVNAGNNTGISGSVTTTGAGATDIDYTVPAVTRTGGLVAGDSLAGNFTVHNGGTDPGAQSVFWTAYISSNATLEIGTDPVLDAGSTAALAAGGASAAIPFAGTWPSGAGTWFLIVSVSATDDTASGNNTTVSSAQTTTAPDVNYTPLSVSSTGGTTAGSALAGTFTIQNVGAHAGGQFVPWTVYLSTDIVLNVGTDTLLATGSLASPGLTAGAVSSAIPFAGTWPSSTSAATWRLIASVGAGDDVNAGNDTAVSSGVVVNPPNIDTVVTAVNNTGVTTAGAALNGEFTIHNNGTANGSATIAWTAYLSANNTLEVTDQVLATGTNAALAAGATAGPIGFAGTWPAGAATWYLIVKVAASDDINTGNDTTVSTSILVTTVAPAYAITSVPLPTGSTTEQAVSGTFTIQNTGTGAGTSAVNWQVYASLGDAVYSSGDVLLMTGSFAGLAAAGTSSPAYAGTWPATAGTYYIVVRATASDAPGIADAASPVVTVSLPPAPDYTVSVSSMPWRGFVSTAMNSITTPQITIQNISANTGYKSVTWSVYRSLDKLLDAGDTLIQTGSISALAGGGSQVVTFGGTWPASPGGLYWLIASVHATDDVTLTNNVVHAPHAVGVGDYVYLEGGENNGDSGPVVTLAQTSDMGVTSFSGNKGIVIQGTMDAYNAYDTYRFITNGTMSQLNMRAVWATGYDDLDLCLWDSGGSTDLYSSNVGGDSEPGNGTFSVTGVTPRTCYVSAWFYLAGNTSGSTGQPYVIYVKSLP